MWCGTNAHGDGMCCVPVCCCVRVGRNVSAFDVQRVTRLLCYAFMCQVYALPVTMAVSLGLLVYASYKSLNTAQIRLIMEDHSPSWVKELQERGLLKPFSEVVVRREARAVDRVQVFLCAGGGKAAAACSVARFLTAAHCACHR